MLRSGINNLSASLVSMLVVLVSTPVLVSLLGLASYGIWSLVSAVVGIMILAEGGLSITTTVFLSKDLERADAPAISQTLTVTLFGIAILGAVAGITVWFGAPFIISTFSHLTVVQSEEAVAALKISAFVVIFRLLQQLSVASLQALGRYGITSTVMSVQSITLSTGLVMVAATGRSIANLMLWSLCNTLIFLFILTALSIRAFAPYRVRPSANLDRIREIGSYSCAVWGTTLGSALFGQADRIIVGLLLSPSSLGTYSLVTSLSTRINTVSAALIQPILPRISRELSKPILPRSALVQTVKQAMISSTVVAFSLGIGLLAAAPYITSLMFHGSDTTVTLSALKSASIVYAIYSANAVGYYILIAANPVLSFRIQFGAALVSLLLIALGARLWGTLGAVSGNIGYASIWLLTFFAMSRISVDITTWLTWIRPPLIWFTSVTCLLLVLKTSELFDLSVAVIAILGVYLWLATRFASTIPLMAGRIPHWHLSLKRKFWYSRVTR